ncbi:MAG: hypothetical protein AB7S71_22480 [Dongiaceae bacterium]
MSVQEISNDVVPDGHAETANRPAPKRPRPLTAAQEALFFGIAFTLAVVLQLGVILKVANIISW